ncbi:MAG: hypothetical protein KDB80_14270 [Planctomycetes bacterium]|nr:hypothetical protein [Planctomycetota bacterium]
MNDDPIIQPVEGFRPEDWTSKIRISSDFVDRTFERVFDDLDEIEREAALVDEIELPRELLDELAPPKISGGFVERVTVAVQSSRETSWNAMLESFTPPEPTEDFVDRTLSALQLERSGLRLLAPEPAARPVAPPRRSRLRLALAAAALLVAVIAFSFLGPGGTPERKLLVTAQHFTPAPWSTAVTTLNEHLHGELAFHPVAFVQRGGGR